MLEVTDAQVRAKAIQLGLIGADDDLPRHLRSRIVAALTQDTAGPPADDEPPQPRLAREIVVQPRGVVLVDGRPFPWLVADEPMEIHLSGGGPSTVRLTLLADSVQVLKSRESE
ncbi:hypothetical protein ACMA1D_01895 [Streptomyces sp. 796.1]|uniref:hypothetical protein n=1 Tax=Streptomyces sp. 796.1 TaxID=3163029 RepID=UPI0039C9C680